MALICFRMWVNKSCILKVQVVELLEWGPIVEACVKNSDLSWRLMTFDLYT